MDWTALARLYDVIGDLKRSEQAYKTVIKLQPDHYLIWYSLAYIKRKQEDYEEAKKAFKRII